MDRVDVAHRANRIAAMAGDPEAAHSAEDELYVDVLYAIAAGASNPGELAEEALRVRKLTFARWYA